MLWRERVNVLPKHFPPILHTPTRDTGHLSRLPSTIWWVICLTNHWHWFLSHLWLGWDLWWWLGNYLAWHAWTFSFRQEPWLLHDVRQQPCRRETNLVFSHWRFDWLDLQETGHNWDLRFWCQVHCNEARQWEVEGTLIQTPRDRDTFNSLTAMDAHEHPLFNKLLLYFLGD